MRALDDLKSILDEIEKQNDWEHKFVQDMAIIKEEGGKLTDPQFLALLRIHKKYFLDKRMTRPYL